MENRRGPTRGSRRLSRRGAKAYQWAMEGAFAVPIAMGLGYWADTYFGTSPYLLLVGAVVGFGALVRRLMRLRPLVEAGDDEDGPQTREDDPQTREDDPQTREDDPQTREDDPQTKRSQDP
jgi:F0F1-type ATP synthase assembly protein I